MLNFDLFVCATVFLLPWYPFIDWKFPIHAIFLLARFLVFAVVLVFQVSSGVSLKSWLWAGWMRKGVWLFAAIATTSLLISEYRSVSSPYPALATLLSYIATFFSMMAWAHTQERIARILKIVLISGLGVCLFGFYQAFEGSFTGLYFSLYPNMEGIFDAQGGWSGRITSFLFHYNSLAGYLNTGAAVALGTAVLATERRLRTLGFTCLVASVAALYLTGSRGGWAGYVAIVFIGICFMKPRRKTIAVVLIAAILSATIVLSLAYIGSVQGDGGLQADRVQNVDDFTLESRVAIWGAAAVVFLQHPVLGGGIGTFRLRFHQLIPGINEDLDAHNLYLQLLAETGIVGFVAFLALMWGFFWRNMGLVRSNNSALSRMIGMGAAGSIVAMMGHGLVDYIFNVSPQFGALFWMVLGLGVAAHDQAKNALKEGRE
jgi:putative inorganic carbon (HCO3(-)) transporter